MDAIIQQTQIFVENCVAGPPKGTNQNMLQLMLSIMSGKFLDSRGALFPALAASGYSADTCHRIENTLRTGVYSVQEVIDAQRSQVLSSNKFEIIYRQGYRALDIDLTFVGRPALKDAKGKYYRGSAGKAVLGVGCALVCEVGRVKDKPGKRMGLLKEIVSETGLQVAGQSKLQALALKQIAAKLPEDAIVVHDAGAKVTEIQSVAMARYLVRKANNAVFRRNYLPERTSKRGRPAEYGERIRPTDRTHKGHLITACQPDKTNGFRRKSRKIRVKIWNDVVLASQKVAADNELLNVFVFDDPLYKKPWVLITNVRELRPRVVYGFYLDRWPVEHPPLVSKIILGMQRQFVFNPICRERLLAFGLVAGNMLTWLAHQVPPQASGFPSTAAGQVWDRKPKQTPGRLRRTLAKADLSKLAWNNPTISKKDPRQTICRPEYWVISEPPRPVGPGSRESAFIALNSRIHFE